MLTRGGKDAFFFGVGTRAGSSDGRPLRANVSLGSGGGSGAVFGVGLVGKDGGTGGALFGSLATLVGVSASLVMVLISVGGVAAVLSAPVSNLSAPLIVGESAVKRVASGSLLVASVSLRACAVMCAYSCGPVVVAQCGAWRDAVARRCSSIQNTRRIISVLCLYVSSAVNTDYACMHGCALAMTSCMRIPPVE